MQSRPVLLGRSTTYAPCKRLRYELMCLHEACRERKYCSITPYLLHNEMLSELAMTCSRVLQADCSSILVARGRRLLTHQTIVLDVENGRVSAVGAACEKALLIRPRRFA